MNKINDIEAKAKVEVKLLKKHIHAGIERAEGELISVPAHVADMLARLGVIAPRGDNKPAGDSKAAQ